MKLTDKQLRECAKGGHWCNIERRPEMARQLLAARKALRWIAKARTCYSANSMRAVARAALKQPQEPQQ